jgi:hypothetical protein
VSTITETLQFHASEFKQQNKCNTSLTPESSTQDLWIKPLLVLANFRCVRAHIVWCWCHIYIDMWFPACREWARIPKYIRMKRVSLQKKWMSRWFRNSLAILQPKQLVINTTYKWEKETERKKHLHTVLSPKTYRFTVAQNNEQASLPALTFLL